VGGTWQRWGGREGRGRREREERSRERRGGASQMRGGGRLYCTVLYVIGSCCPVSPRPTTVVVKIFPSPGPDSTLQTKSSRAITLNLL